MQKYCHARRYLALSKRADDLLSLALDKEDQHRANWKCYKNDDASLCRHLVDHHEGNSHLQNGDCGALG
jgi:hypothetical protein